MLHKILYTRPPPLIPSKSLQTHAFNRTFFDSLQTEPQLALCKSHFEFLTTFSPLLFIPPRMRIHFKWTICMHKTTKMLLILWHKRKIRNLFIWFMCLCVCEWMCHWMNGIYSICNLFMSFVLCRLNLCVVFSLIHYLELFKDSGGWKRRLQDIFHSPRLFHRCGRDTTVSRREFIHFRLFKLQAVRVCVHFMPSWGWNSNFYAVNFIELTCSTIVPSFLSYFLSLFT